MQISSIQWWTVSKVCLFFLFVEAPDLSFAEGGIALGVGFGEQSPHTPNMRKLMDPKAKEKASQRSAQVEELEKRQREVEHLVGDCFLCFLCLLTLHVGAKSDWSQDFNKA